MDAVVRRPAHALSSVSESTLRAKAGTLHLGRGADEVRRHGAFRGLAHLGLFARAVVYALVGVLVIEIAVRGRSSSAADSQGAFAAIARKPVGPEMLALVGIGLAAYALWRFVEAVSRAPQGQQVSVWTRVGWCCIGIVYVFLSVNAFMLMSGSQPQSPEQHPSSFAARVLGLPAGSVLLGVIATAVAAAGAALIVWAAIHDFAEVLHRGEMGRVSLGSVRPTGVVGNMARGAAVLLVAASLYSSAVSADASRAKSLDAALESVAGSTPGAVLLGAMGVGFLAFSVFSVIEARFRRV